MPTGIQSTPKRTRLWPGAVWPLGMTALLAVAIWMFVGKVAADQETADALALRLESYARLEAGDLAERARAVAQDAADDRFAGRRNQEKNLRLEVRGVMDAVYRVLTANLEKARRGTAARRDVGVFPPGFDGVRSFLEIAPPGRGDKAVDALRAIAPELSALLPAGCSLAVIEDNARELLAVGGGAQGENMVGEAMTRDFLFSDAGGDRLWTLRVEVAAPDAFPIPDARELAGVITEKLGQTRLDNVAWRGWLLGPGGQVASSFPAEADDVPRRADAALPPFIDKPEEWVEIDGLRLVWLERRAALSGLDLTPAVAVAIDRPAPPLELMAEFWRDGRWNVTLGILALLTAAGWAWFIRLALVTRRENAEAVPDVPAAGPEVSVARGASRVRLVRDGAAARSVPDAAGVIVADVGERGGVKISVPAEVPDAAEEEVVEVAPVRRRRTVPTGSLYRLQAMHRGGKGIGGSRVLDGARSQLLRDLALRVRPALRVEIDRKPAGRSTERMVRDVKKVL